MHSTTARHLGALAGAMLACAFAGPAAALPVEPSPSAGASRAPGGVVSYPSRSALIAHVDDLRALGLTVQPLRRLPMALVAGTRRQLAAVAASGGGARFWPDEALEPHSVTSNRAIGVDRVHAQGLTGRGMTIALIDTGIDATLPQLADHVTHNVLMLGPQRAVSLGPVDAPRDLIVTPVDLGPGSNTDTLGHGTGTAGIAAADGTGDPSLVGVVPDAEVVGYNAGDLSGMSMHLAAMDHILDHPGWGIDVVNNSYGRAKFEVFDPEDPLNVATRALHDAGIAVVFSAGNAGEAGPMSINQRAVAPWVISVGGIDARGDAWPVSSQGLVLDNSVADPVVDGHVSATGDRLGLYHPSVLAPATDMEFPCPTLNIWGCVPRRTTGPYLEGTSFAAPQVAGVVALLKQVRPDLTPGEARRVLEVTAKPTADDAPVWRAGFGVVDADAAVELVRSPAFRASLSGLHRAAEARLLADRPWRVKRSDLWTSPAPVVTAGEAVPLPVHDVDVPAGTDALSVGLATYETTGAAAALEGYAVVVRDAGGAIVGRTRQHGATLLGPVSSVVLDLRGTSPEFGRWTLSVEGVAGVNDEFPSSFSDLVVHAALLEEK